MLQMTFKVNGNEVTPDTVGNPMHKIVLKSMEDQLWQKLRGVVCPEHQVGPHVTIDIAGGRQHVSIAGCCQPLIDRTSEALMAAN